MTASRHRYSNLEASEGAGMDNFSAVDVASEIEKGKAVHSQLQIWDTALEIRVHLQKVVVLANQLPKHNKYALFRLAALQKDENNSNLIDQGLSCFAACLGRRSMPVHKKAAKVKFEAPLRKVGGRCPLRGLVTRQGPRDIHRSVAGGAWHHLADSVRDVVQRPLWDWLNPTSNSVPKLSASAHGVRYVVMLQLRLLATRAPELARLIATLTARRDARRYFASIGAGISILCAAGSAAKSCEVAARQVAVARLTRPADRSFKNQRESLRATRNEAAALLPLKRRLEQDLLSLVCDKKRDDQASGRQRLPSPVRSRQKERHSRERRDSGDQLERRRRRKSSPQRRRINSSSPSSSSSSSDRSHGKRRRKPRRRPRRSDSPEERVAALRAPPSAAPSARASFRRRARQFTTPPAARTGDVIRSASGSPARRQSKTANDEKREQMILANSLQQLHNALEAKRRQQFPGKSLLADLRSYCRDVARRAQSEDSLSEAAASPSSQQEHRMLEQEEFVPDPEFIVDSPPVEDESRKQSVCAHPDPSSPASSLLPDSPREDEPFFKEAEEQEERLERRLERREPEEEAATAGAALWQRGGLPGTSASAFLVPWNRPAARQAGPHLAAPPVPYVPSASSSGLIPVGWIPEAWCWHDQGLEKSGTAAAACFAAGGGFVQLARGVVPDADDGGAPSAFRAVLVRAFVVDDAATLFDADVPECTASASSSSSAPSSAATSDLGATSRGVHHRVLPSGRATGEALFQPDP
ncbi:hypothetical protein MTO96_002295 [Rhipicephalus appendiculatus]